jgi:hypothetical protein
MKSDALFHFTFFINIDIKTNVVNPSQAPGQGYGFRVSCSLDTFEIDEYVVVQTPLFSGLHA